jgi:hypothetical protein
VANVDPLQLSACDAWRWGDDVGASALWMARVMLGRGNGCYSYPLDAGDIGRCIRFVDAIGPTPEQWERLAKSGREWGRICTSWTLLHSLHGKKKLRQVDRLLETLHEQ